ncbi:MAG TPA: PilX N-terminal domain-containing pilus assembly protein [Dyella sp.]|uniref:pilus assembly PilX family protein n=1 Tax=Dyella sp. TaxID=1869338 RepID=UPI002BEC09F8|nr:PilX N-terminal domain-containing pilus assembly protein [Dyella sp.]HUB91579.1 PilX N-terminal domain-containing pilus assembly protein [Dyella sp.]
MHSRAWGTIPAHRAQHGFALLMALIFLVLLSMFAIAASQHSLLQERMAGSLRHAQQARLAAEATLRGVEYKLWSLASQAGAQLHCGDNFITQDDGCVIYRADAAPYAANGAVTRFQTAAGWIDGISLSYKGPTGGGYAPALARDPVYIIEDLGSERPPGVGGLHESGSTGPNNGGQLDTHLYRITARATGGNANVVSVVQSTFNAPRP